MSSLSELKARESRIKNDGTHYISGFAIALISFVILLFLGLSYVFSMSVWLPQGYYVPGADGLAQQTKLQEAFILSGFFSIVAFISSSLLIRHKALREVRTAIAKAEARQKADAITREAERKIEAVARDASAKLEHLKNRAKSIFSQLEIHLSGD